MSDRQRPPDFDPRQSAEIEAFLATLKPREELAYRIALWGLFPRCRGRAWEARRDALMERYAKDERTTARLLARAGEIAEGLQGGER